MTFVFFPDFTPDHVSSGNNHCRDIIRFGRNKKVNPQDSWRAPEHSRLTSDMRRDYPKDDLGRRIPGRGKELVIDPKPTIMKPERPIRVVFI